MKREEAKTEMWFDCEIQEEALFGAVAAELPLRRYVTMFLQTSHQFLYQKHPLTCFFHIDMA